MGENGGRKEGNRREGGRDGIGKKKLAVVVVVLGWLTGYLMGLFACFFTRRGKGGGGGGSSIKSKLWKEERRKKGFLPG